MNRVSDTERSSILPRKAVFPVSDLFPRNAIRLSLLLALLFATDLVLAQDPPAAAAKSPTGKPAVLSEEQKLKAEEDRRRQIREDVELRARFANTIWNDVQLTAGEPGYTWWLRTQKNKGPESTWVRKWNLSTQKDLPEVGTWDVKQGELLLIAPDGRIVARGKLDAEDEVQGEYYNPDRKQTYGSFQLIEQNLRQYTIVPFRAIDPQAGK